MTREEINILQDIVDVYEKEDIYPLLNDKQVRTIKKAIEALKAQEWTPCSERLPSDSGNYLITVADLRLGHNGEHTVTMADFYAKAKKWNSVVDVTAWMPLPKPYNEESEDKE